MNKPGRVTNLNEITPDENELMTIWRLLRPNPEQAPESSDNGTFDAAVGLIKYRQRTLDPASADAHSRPEYYFTISGRGVLWLDGETSDLNPGDAFAVPAGARHLLSGRDGDELEVVYVAIK